MCALLIICVHLCSYHFLLANSGLNTLSYLALYMYIHIYMLGCAVLLCLVVCLTLLASFLLPSHISLKRTYTLFAHKVY